MPERGSAAVARAGSGAGVAAILSGRAVLPAPEAATASALPAGTTKSALVARLNVHELSWWDGQWWCRCGAEYLTTDVDAERHYSVAMNDAIALHNGMVQLERERREEHGEARTLQG